MNMNTGSDKPMREPRHFSIVHQTKVLKTSIDDLENVINGINNTDNPPDANKEAVAQLPCLADFLDSHGEVLVSLRQRVVELTAKLSDSL